MDPSIIYQALTGLATPVSAVRAVVRAVSGREPVAAVLQRLGWSSEGRQHDGPLIWFHAPTLGDCAVALPVLMRCLAEYNNTVRIVLTTISADVQHLLSESLPARVVVQLMPLDNPVSTAIFLRRWRPQVGIILASPVHPNLVHTARSMGVKLALLNGSLSAGMAARWNAHGPSRHFLNDVLKCFQLIVPQSDQDVVRFRQFGVLEEQMPGWCPDLRHAAALGASVRYLRRPSRKAIAHLRGAIGARPLWLAASTHSGEERIIAAVHMQLARRVRGVLTVIAPRVAARCGEVAAHLQEDGVRVAMWSERLISYDNVDVLLLDVAADLPLMYCTAEVALVGNSLHSGCSGHSLAEAAVSGCALLVGPHAGRFAQMANELNHAALLMAEEEAAAVARAGFTYEVAAHPAAFDEHPAADCGAQPSRNEYLSDEQRAWGSFFPTGQAGVSRSTAAPTHNGVHFGGRLHVDIPPAGSSPPDVNSPAAHTTDYTRDEANCGGGAYTSKGYLDREHGVVNLGLVTAGNSHRRYHASSQSSESLSSHLSDSTLQTTVLVGDGGSGNTSADGSGGFQSPSGAARSRVMLRGDELENQEPWGRSQFLMARQSAAAGWPMHGSGRRSTVDGTDVAVPFNVQETALEAALVNRKLWDVVFSNDCEAQPWSASAALSETSVDLTGLAAKGLKTRSTIQRLQPSPTPSPHKAAAAVFASACASTTPGCGSGSQCVADMLDVERFRSMSQSSQCCHRSRPTSPYEPTPISMWSRTPGAFLTAPLPHRSSASGVGAPPEDWLRPVRQALHPTLEHATGTHPSPHASNADDSALVERLLQAQLPSRSVTSKAPMVSPPSLTMEQPLQVHAVATAAAATEPTAASAGSQHHSTARYLPDYASTTAPSSHPATLVPVNYTPQQLPAAVPSPPILEGRGSSASSMSGVEQGSDGSTQRFNLAQQTMMLQQDAANHGQSQDEERTSLSGWAAARSRRTSANVPWCPLGVSDVISEGEDTETPSAHPPSSQSKLAKTRSAGSQLSNDTSNYHSLPPYGSHGDQDTTALAEATAAMATAAAEALRQASGVMLMPQAPYQTLALSAAAAAAIADSTGSMSAVGGPVAACAKRWPASKNLFNTPLEDLGAALSASSSYSLLNGNNSSSGASTNSSSSTIALSGIPEVQCRDNLAGCGSLRINLLSAKRSVESAVSTQSPPLFATEPSFASNLQPTRRGHAGPSAGTSLASILSRQLASPTSDTSSVAVLGADIGGVTNSGADTGAPFTQPNRLAPATCNSPFGSFAPTAMTDPSSVPSVTGSFSCGVSASADSPLDSGLAIRIPNLAGMGGAVKVTAMRPSSANGTEATTPSTAACSLHHESESDAVLELFGIEAEHGGSSEALSPVPVVPAITSGSLPPTGAAKGRRKVRAAQRQQQLAAAAAAAAAGHSGPAALHRLAQALLIPSDAQPHTSGIAAQLNTAAPTPVVQESALAPTSNPPPLQLPASVTTATAVDQASGSASLATMDSWLASSLAYHPHTRLNAAVSASAGAPSRSSSTPVTGAPLLPLVPRPPSMPTITTLPSPSKSSPSRDEMDARDAEWLQTAAPRVRTPRKLRCTHKRHGSSPQASAGLLLSAAVPFNGSMQGPSPRSHPEPFDSVAFWPVGPEAAECPPTPTTATAAERSSMFQYSLPPTPTAQGPSMQFFAANGSAVADRSSPARGVSDGDGSGASTPSTPMSRLSNPSPFAISTFDRPCPFVYTDCGGHLSDQAVRSMSSPQQIDVNLEQLGLPPRYSPVSRSGSGFGRSSSSFGRHSRNIMRSRSQGYPNQVARQAALDASNAAAIATAAAAAAASSGGGGCPGTPRSAKAQSHVSPFSAPPTFMPPATSALAQVDAHFGNDADDNDDDTSDTGSQAATVIAFGGGAPFNPLAAGPPQGHESSSLLMPTPLRLHGAASGSLAKPDSPNADSAAHATNSPAYTFPLETSDIVTSSPMATTSGESTPVLMSSSQLPATAYLPSLDEMAALTKASNGGQHLTVADAWAALRGAGASGSAAAPGDTITAGIATQISAVENHFSSTGSTPAVTTSARAAAMRTSNDVALLRSVSLAEGFGEALEALQACGSSGNLSSLGEASEEPHSDSSPAAPGMQQPTLLASNSNALGAVTTSPQLRSRQLDELIRSAYLEAASVAKPQARKTDPGLPVTLHLPVSAPLPKLSMRAMHSAISPGSARSGGSGASTASGSNASPSRRCASMCLDRTVTLALGLVTPLCSPVESPAATTSSDASGHSSACAGTPMLAGAITSPPAARPTVDTVPAARSPLVPGAVDAASGEVTALGEQQPEPELGASKSQQASLERQSTPVLLPEQISIALSRLASADSVVSTLVSHTGSVLNLNKSSSTHSSPFRAASYASPADSPPSPRPITSAASLPAPSTLPASDNMTTGSGAAVDSAAAPVSRAMQLLMLAEGPVASSISASAATLASSATDTQQAMGTFRPLLSTTDSSVDNCENFAPLSCSSPLYGSSSLKGMEDIAACVSPLSPLRLRRATPFELSVSTTISPASAAFSLSAAAAFAASASTAVFAPSSTMAGNMLSANVGRGAPSSAALLLAGTMSPAAKPRLSSNGGIGGAAASAASNMSSAALLLAGTMSPSAATNSSGFNISNALNTGGATASPSSAALLLAGTMSPIAVPAPAMAASLLSPTVGGIHAPSPGRPLLAPSPGRSPGAIFTPSPFASSRQPLAEQAVPFSDSEAAEVQKAAGSQAWQQQLPPLAPQPSVGTLAAQPPQIAAVEPDTPRAAPSPLASPHAASIFSAPDAFGPAGKPPAVLMASPRAGGMPAYRASASGAFSSCAFTPIVPTKPSPTRQASSPARFPLPPPSAIVLSPSQEPPTPRSSLSPMASPQRISIFTSDNVDASPMSSPLKSPARAPAASIGSIRSPRPSLAGNPQVPSSPRAGPTAPLAQSPQKPPPSPRRIPVAPVPWPQTGPSAPQYQLLPDSIFDATVSSVCGSPAALACPSSPSEGSPASPRLAHSHSMPARSASERGLLNGGGGTAAGGSRAAAAGGSRRDPDLPPARPARHSASGTIASGTLSGAAPSPPRTLTRAAAAAAAASLSSPQPSFADNFTFSPVKPSPRQSPLRKAVACPSSNDALLSGQPPVRRVLHMGQTSGSTTSGSLQPASGRASVGGDSGALSTTPDGGVDLGRAVAQLLPAQLSRVNCCGGGSMAVGGTPPIPRGGYATSSTSLGNSDSMAMPAARPSTAPANTTVHSAHDMTFGSIGGHATASAPAIPHIAISANVPRDGAKPSVSGTSVGAVQQRHEPADQARMLSSTYAAMEGSAAARSVMSACERLRVEEQGEGMQRCWAGSGIVQPRSGSLSRASSANGRHPRFGSGQLGLSDPNTSASQLSSSHLTGPAVWVLSDAAHLATAVEALLLQPLERRNRGFAAAQASARLAAGLVDDVWKVLDNEVIAPALAGHVAAAAASPSAEDAEAGSGMDTKSVQQKALASWW